MKGLNVLQLKYYDELYQDSLGMSYKFEEFSLPNINQGDTLEIRYYEQLDAMLCKQINGYPEAGQVYFALTFFLFVCFMLVMSFIYFITVELRAIKSKR